MRCSIVFAMPVIFSAILLTGCGGSRESTLSGARCLAALDDHDVDYQPVNGSESHDSGCNVDTAVRVRRSTVALSKPVTMSCGLAARLDQFTREVIQPLARSDLGERVNRINHLGSYVCRNNTSVRGRLSEHAFGRAIDIAGFRLADGKTVSVEQDWSRPGPNGTFLHHVAHSACQYFSVVLTPDSNADHYNHFHFDIGPGKVCSAG
jgi:hypothetical protein